jgi:hypothetical protein
MSKWRTTEFCENCYVEWCCQSECKYHLLHRIKQARKEIENLITWDEGSVEMRDVLEILDKLIKEGEEGIWH